MQPTVIFWFISKVSPEVLSNFGLEEFRVAGFEVILVEISEIYFGKAQKAETADADKGFISIKSVDQFVKLLKDKSLMHILAYVGFNPLTRPFYKAIAQHNVPYTSVLVGKFPRFRPTSSKSTSWQKTRFNVIQALRLIRDQLLIATGIYSGPKYVLHTAQAFPISHTVQCVFAQKLYSHTFDVDHMRKASAYSSAEKYAVYIDQNIPFHPDSKVVNLSKVDPSTYYANLNRFFVLFEKITGLKILIAAHPKANVAEAQIYFGETPQIQNQTPGLIKGSSAVLGHYSTAFGMAILLKKPILFLNSTQWDEAKYGSTCLGDQIKIFASWLGKKPISMDSEEILEPVIKTELEVHGDCYERFIQGFLIHPKSQNTGTCYDPLIHALQKDATQFTSEVSKVPHGQTTLPVANQNTIIGS